MSQAVLVLVHSKVIIFDFVLSGGLARRYEVLLKYLANRLAILVTNDVPVADLLIDSWVVDQGPVHHRRLLL